MTYRNSPIRRALPWLLPLLVAFGIRLLVWWLLPYRLPNTVPISDEGEYRAAAIWLAAGRGFSFFKDWIWTRPPLYVLFVAVHVKLFGPVNVVPLRLSQALLSTATVGLVMAWAWRLAPPAYARRVALISGWAMALSYSLASFSFFVLSETLFMFWLFAALLALTIWAQRGDWRWLLLGGVLLGFGVLTRALLAGTLPLIAGWVWWTNSQRRGVARPSIWRALLAPTLLTLVVSAIMLPWSIYNTRFYGAKQLILIDTTGGYNAMLGSQAAHFAYEDQQKCRINPAPTTCGPPRSRDEDAVHDELIAASSDHSERQAYAYRTAWSWFTENPLGFVDKTARELLDLVIINYGGAERLYRAYSVGETPIPHQLGLLADDLLYLVAAPLAVLGLFRRQGRAGKGLALIWLVYNLVTGPLFFAINRFRLPLLPILFIYAACALVEWRMPPADTSQRWLARGISAALAGTLLFSFVVGPRVIKVLDNKNGSVLINAAIAIRNRWIAGDCERAALALRNGALDEAQRLIDRGMARASTPQDRLPCFALSQARVYQGRGDVQRALALLQFSTSGDLNINNARTLMVEGDILRAQGNVQKAREAFAARQVETQNDLGWAWQHLVPPPTKTIDVGGGLDLGLIEGFDGREFTDKANEFGSGYRWTGPEARLRFPQASTGTPQVLQLVVNGARPAGEAPATLTMLQDTRVIGQVTVPGDWSQLTIPVAALPAGQDVVITLQTNVFVPSPANGPPNPLRLRGVQIKRAELQDRAQP